MDHELNSMNVAKRLAATITQLGGDVESAAALTEDGWAKVVLLAHLNEMNAAETEGREVEWEPGHGYLPSKMTRQYVYARLVWVDEDKTEDVFAGLPGVDD